MMSRIIALAALATAFLWCFGTTLASLLREWHSDENYSVGQLVPIIALYLVWRIRKELRELRCESSYLLGIPVVVLGLIGWLLGGAWTLESLQRYGMVTVIVGLVCCVGGATTTRRLAGVLLFLFLMVPLPGRIHNLISSPLQSLATSGAVFSLELLGITVTSEGNTLMLNHSIPVAVAEACSGLRMLTAFVVVAATLTFVVPRTFPVRVIVLISSVPVAIFCNLVRLVVTAWMFLYVGSETAERFFHDFAGWLMMPMAVGIVMIELWLIPKLVFSTSTLTRDLDGINWRLSGER